jgi:tripartite-type tricarboxylate transporter receptor subunit TctC
MSHRIPAASPGFMAIATAAISAACAWLAGSAHAQNFPSKPIRFLVGASPGGGADFVARTLSPRLTESLGQTVVVENRPGANGVVASELLARAAPDGYTIKINITGDAINPSLMKLSFDCLKDFAFITLAAESQNLLVAHPSFPATNVKALVALSKKQPGAIVYGSQGIGSSGHLAGELFQLMTGTRWTHVPYKGGAPALVDLVGGQISVSFGNIPTVIQHVRAGKLRAIAVTGAKRSAAVPEIPTVAEGGVAGYQVSNWFGISARAGTPPEVIARLHADIARALKTPEVRAAFNNAGAEPGDTTPAQFAAFFQNEYTKWAKVVRAAGIKGE